MITILSVYHAAAADNLPREQRRLPAVSPRRQPQAQGDQHQLRHPVTSTGLHSPMSKFLALDPTSRLPACYTRALRLLETHCLQPQRIVSRQTHNLLLQQSNDFSRQSITPSLTNLQIHERRLELDTCHRRQRHKEWLGTHLGTSSLCLTISDRSICSRYATARCGLGPH